MAYASKAWFVVYLSIFMVIARTWYTQAINRVLSSDTYQYIVYMHIRKQKSCVYQLAQLAAGYGGIVNSVHHSTTGLQLQKNITVEGALVYGLGAHEPTCTPW